MVVAVAATGATVPLPSNKICASLPSSSARRCCISDNENYLLTRSNCGLISKDSKSSYEPCSNDSSTITNNTTTTTTNQTLNQICRFHPIQPLSANDENPPFRSGSASDGSSSLAVMLYDASSVQFGNYYTDRLLRESHTSGAGSAVPLQAEAVESHGNAKSGMLGSVDRSASRGDPSELVNVSSVQDLTDRGASGGGDKQAKLSSSSPFRRFGMAMRRKKKRSLKLKHAATGSSNGGIGGNTTLYGSCASNLSGISVGNGSMKGMIAASDGSGVGGSSKRSKLKFRWLRNMRSNPNLKETLANSVQLRTTTTIGSGTSSSSCLLEAPKGTATTTTTTSNVPIPKSP
uniref:Uncharacterized protein n=1 Tax=Anopheles maculatus TaxID=74869 RepID=A0A182SK73_9DIPT